MLLPVSDKLNCGFCVAIASYTYVRAGIQLALQLYIVYMYNTYVHGVSGVHEENVCVDELHEVKVSEDCLSPSLQFPVLHLNTSQSVPLLRGLLW